jgi:tetratricopeptide (TPR) repeat protein
LVLEDLHWADEGLLDFVKELAEWTTGVPMLVLCTARPELLARRSGWGGGRANALTLSLSPLSAAETAQLVHDLLRRPVLTGELQQTLLERAGGNPLYAEEFARLVTERGTADLALPETVHGIIASRLDALEPQDKRLLQDAAVVGKVFWAGAVAALDGASQDELEHRLRELERRELIRRERKSSVERETEYVFRHVLIRDVAYAQIPRAERSERHRHAAQWIASLGRPEDHAELLAQHYLAALEYARAAGGDTSAFTSAALQALREAGDRASALGAYGLAARYFEAALDLVPEDDPKRPELLYHYGAALFWAENKGEEVLEEAVRHLRSVDRETAARAGLLLSRVAWSRGDRQADRKWLAQVDDLLVDLPDSIVQTEALVARAGFEMVASEFEQALRFAREALPRTEGLDRPDLRARVFDIIGVSRVGLGDEGGVDDQRRAIEIAREGRAIWELHHGFNNRGSLQMMLGLVAAFEANLEEWRRIFDEVPGTAHNRAWFLAAQATADHLAGRWDAALERIERLLVEFADGTTHYLESIVRPIRASIELARDLTAEAQAKADRAVAVAESSGDPQVLGWSLSARASVRLAEGRTEEATADLDELLLIGARIAPGLNENVALPVFGWLAVDLDRRAEAETIVGASSRRWAKVARAILVGDGAIAADLLAEIGHRPAEAYACLRAGGEHVHRALSFYRSVGATRYIREAESLLAASA